METQLESLRSEALLSIAACSDEAQIEQLRVRYLGRGGELTVLSDRMREVSKEDKPKIGKLLNETRAAVTGALEECKAALVVAQEARAFEGIEVTLPGSAFPVGALHPIT